MPVRVDPVGEADLESGLSLASRDRPERVRHAQELAARVRSRVSGLPVVVGVKFDIALQKAVIVVREVATGRIVAQIPEDTPAAQLRDVGKWIRDRLVSGGGMGG